MNEHTFTVPYPPSVNTYWRWMKGKPIVAKPGREYRKTVNDVVNHQRVPTFGVSRIGVIIRLEMPDRRKRDLDNVLKAMLDAIDAAGVYDDDSQIDAIYVERGSVKPPGLAVVTIKELGAVDA